MPPANATPNPQAPALYAGDVTPQEAWDGVVSDVKAMVVDVRTQAEWQFIGTPDLQNAKGKLALLSWKLYPSFSQNPDFVAQLQAACPDKNAPLFFVCRSGGRSTDAAIAMTEAGYTRCYNVAGGFEGRQNEVGQRGLVEGWKADGLPWRQS